MGALRVRPQGAHHKTQTQLLRCSGPHAIQIIASTSAITIIQEGLSKPMDRSRQFCVTLGRGYPKGRPTGGS